MLERALDEYGAAWVQAQRWTLPLFGYDWSALGRWSAALGALMAALTDAAARAAGGTRGGSLVGALVCAYAPVAVRVGHSESTLVVAQLLVAVALWLAATGIRWGAVAAIGLLALGHPLGPLYALGTALACWAVLPSRTHALVVEGTPTQPRRGLQWLSLAALVAMALAGLALNLAGNASLLAHRAHTTDQILPIPLNPWQFWLWLDPAWAPMTVLVLALVGGWAVVALRPQPWARSLGLPVGALAVTATGWLVVACVTDALRYQAPLAPLLAVLAGLAMLPLPLGMRGRGALTIVRNIAWIATLVAVLRHPPGRLLQDAQAQAFTDVQLHLPHESWVLRPDVPAGARHVVVEPPNGALWARGPQLHPYSSATLRADCTNHRPPPSPLYVWLPPDCDAAELPGAVSACALLRSAAMPGPPVAEGDVPWLSQRYPEGLPGEFHRHRSTVGHWQLLRAGCR
jgi:hypothetical protein